jgi:hypothetical protein
MDRDEAFAQVRAHIVQSEVETLKGKWETSRTYCVAPADLRLSLHLLVKGALTSESWEWIGRLSLDFVPDQSPSTAP